MRSWLYWLLRCNQVFCSYDLPLPAASDPSVSPDKAAPQRIAAASLPSLVALHYCCVAIESYFDIVRMVADEILWCVACVGNHFSFVVEAPFWVHADKIISENTLENARVTTRD